MSWSDNDIDRLFKGAKAPEPPAFREEFWEEMEAMLPDSQAPWSDQEIDRLFRETKAPAPPVFEEAYWAEMETMLPAERRRRYALLWWFSGAAAVAALIGIGAFWFYGNRETTALAGNTSAAASKQTSASTAEQTSDTHTPNNRSVARQTASGNYSAGNTTAVSTIEESTVVRKKAPNLSAGKKRLKIEDIAVAPDFDHGWLPLGEDDELPVPAPDAMADQAIECRHKPVLVATLPLVDPASVLRPETLPVDRTLSDPKPERIERFYAQVAAGIGQSSQRNVSHSSGLLHYYAAGAGLFKRVDNVVLTFGANARVDMAQNVIGSTGFGNPDRTDTKYKQLYSIETPASIGWCRGRNTFAVQLTPGFQTGFSGEVTEFENDMQIRSTRTTSAEKVENSRTLTMEIGFGYWRTLQPNWYLGASVNADALRPFNPTSFAGDPRLMPLNGQVTLRRTF